MTIQTPMTTPNPSAEKQNKKDYDLITAPAVLVIFIITGVFWWLLLSQWFTQETLRLHWECNGSQFDLTVVATEANLKCHD